MSSLNILKKKILHRSGRRGTKEMDLILSNFVKKYIHSFDEKELNDLESLLNIDDEILYKWYSDRSEKTLIPTNNITKKLKRFKL